MIRPTRTSPAPTHIDARAKNPTRPPRLKRTRRSGSGGSGEVVALHEAGHVAADPVLLGPPTRDA